MAVTLDIVDGAGGRKTKDGWEFERIAIVTGVTGSGHEKIYNAVNATGMPDIGYSHPTVTSCLLRTIDTIYVDKDQVKLRLNYKQSTVGSSSGGFEADTIQVGSSVVQVETNKDIDGNDISVSYEYPIGYKRSPHDTALTAAVTKTDGVFVSKLAPQTTLSFNFLDYVSPESYATNYVGKINSAAWRGYAASTWLCTRIIGVSRDNGDTWQVTCEFQYKSDTWKSTVVFVKDDGKPPDTTDANSEKDYWVYDNIDFNNLNL